MGRPPDAELRKRRIYSHAKKLKPEQTSLPDTFGHVGYKSAFKIPKNIGFDRAKAIHAHAKKLASDHGLDFLQVHKPSRLSLHHKSEVTVVGEPNNISAWRAHFVKSMQSGKY